MPKAPSAGQMELFWSLVKQGIIDSENLQMFLQDRDRHAGHIIDCDVAPRTPCGSTVKVHLEGGRFKWDPSQVDLYFSDRQVGSSPETTNYKVTGHELRPELSTKAVMNANVLDYLLAHPELIPKSWKGHSVFFWGTIYIDVSGQPYVRYLCSDQLRAGKWGLNENFYGASLVAAIYKS